MGDYLPGRKIVQAKATTGLSAYRFEAADGFSISLSANNGAYCGPRKDLWELQLSYYNFTWPARNSPPVVEEVAPPIWRGYGSVELGFPSGPVPQLKEHKEGGVTESPDTDSIYPFVPVEDFIALMSDHGGIIQSQWPSLPPMDCSTDDIVDVLDSSAWDGWDTLNWRSIPVIFYVLHGLT